MDIKVWLGQYRKALDYALKCFRELDAIDVSVKSPNMDGMPRSTMSGDNVERMAIRRVVLYERAEKARKEAMDLAEQIYDTIESLEDYGQRTVLVLRYIYGYSWEEVAQNMDTSRRTVLRLHGRALEILRRMKDATQ